MNRLATFAAIAAGSLLLSGLSPARGGGRDQAGRLTVVSAPQTDLDSAASRRRDPRFQAPRAPGRKVDLGWIERLNAAGSRVPGMVSRWSADSGARAPSWVRAPAEFEPQEALLLPVGRLAEDCPKTLTRLVAAIRDSVEVVGIVADATQRRRVERLLRAKGLPAASVRFIRLPHNTKWLRDYGPIFVRVRHRRRAVVDAEYPETGRHEDDVLPGRLARQFAADLIAAPIVFDGGNLLSNGYGLCVTTTAAIFRNSDEADAEARVCRVFRECFGAEQTVFLEPLLGEQTGHVDMFACFTAPAVIVVGSYDPAVDALNAAVLDRNAQRLAGLPTPHGPLRVVRVPMPPHHDNHWRTYTNVVFANKVLLMPTYVGVDRAGREKAMEIFARLLPGWQVVGIDCTALIRGGGALRCVSATVPLDCPARVFSPNGGASAPWQ